jgi:hypothetical protein
MQLFNVKRTKQNIQLHVLKIDIVEKGFKGYFEKYKQYRIFSNSMILFKL